MRHIKFILAAMLAALALASIPAKAQSNAGNITMPDLSTAWQSDFGPVYWIGGYYGDTSKTIEGSLAREGNVWVFRGNWGRSDEKQGIRRMGQIVFRFDATGKSFTGTYTTTSGSTFGWNGQHTPGAAFSGGSKSANSYGYNRNLEFMMRDQASTQAATYARDQEVEPTARCDREMVDFLKKQGVSAASASKLCNN